MAADRLDDPDYPAYTTGRAAEVLGVQQAFLRALDAAGAVTPERSAGGHRRYTRRQLAFAAASGNCSIRATAWVQPCASWACKTTWPPSAPAPPVCSAGSAASGLTVGHRPASITKKAARERAAKKVRPRGGRSDHCPAWYGLPRRGGPSQAGARRGRSRAGHTGERSSGPGQSRSYSRLQEDGRLGQAGLSCLASWLLISTLRGLAASCTGMARVSTPAV